MVISDRESNAASMELVTDEKSPRRTYSPVKRRRRCCFTNDCDPMSFAERCTRVVARSGNCTFKRCANSTCTNRRPMTCQFDCVRGRQFFLCQSCRSQFKVCFVCNKLCKRENENYEYGLRLPVWSETLLQLAHLTNNESTKKVYQQLSIQDMPAEIALVCANCLQDPGVNGCLPADCVGRHGLREPPTESDIRARLDKASTEFQYSKAHCAPNVFFNTMSDLVSNQMADKEQETDAPSQMRIFLETPGQQQTSGMDNNMDEVNYLSTGIVQVKPFSLAWKTPREPIEARKRRKNRSMKEHCDDCTLHQTACGPIVQVRSYGLCTHCLCLNMTAYFSAYAGAFDIEKESTCQLRIIRLFKRMLRFNSILQVSNRMCYYIDKRVDVVTDRNRSKLIEALSREKRVNHTLRRWLMTAIENATNEDITAVTLNIAWASGTDRYDWSAVMSLLCVLSQFRANSIVHQVLRS